MLVSPSQSSPGQEITDAAINTPVNQLAAVINGGIDSANVAASSIGTTQLANGSVTSTKVNFGGAGAGIWWEEIGRTTLTTAGSAISVSSFAAKKYLRFIVIHTGVGATATVEYVQFNGDTGNNYAWRASVNGAAEQANAAVVSWGLFGDIAQSRFVVGEISNAATNPKLGKIDVQITSAAGATVPSRVEFSGKWNNIVNQITRIDYMTSANQFAVGSELIVLGHD